MTSAVMDGAHLAKSCLKSPGRWLACRRCFPDVLVEADWEESAVEIVHLAPVQTLVDLPGVVGEFQDFMEEVLELLGGLMDLVAQWAQHCRASAAREGR